MSGNRFETFEEFPGVGIFVYAIDRSHIVENNKAPFHHFWNVQRISKAGKLHDMFNRVLFSISGYETGVILCERPEVRVFLQGLFGEWPFFLYAENIEVGSFLDLLIPCLVPNLTVTRSDSKPGQNIQTIESDALRGVVENMVRGLNALCEMDDQMTQEAADRRFQAFVDYIKRRYLAS